MTAEQNKLVIRRFIDVVINQRNYAVMKEIVAADFIEDLPFPGQGPGREGLQTVLEIFQAAFSDMQWVIDEQIADGDKVATRFHWTGTHRGNFLGIPATGKQVSVWGMVIDVVRGGIMTQSRILMDTVGLLTQLGVMPGPN